MRVHEHPGVGEAVRIEPASRDGRGWADYAAAHPDATFFHQPGWLEVVTRTFGYRPASLVAWRGERVTGFLPLAVVPTLPWGRSLVSMPLAAYGGAIADDESSTQALLGRAGEDADAVGARFVELRNERSVPGLPTKDLYVTFRRGILATREENLAAVPRNQRRSIRIGIKNGLHAEIGGKNLLNEFYQVYSESVRNLGTPVFPKTLFASLLDTFGNASRILAVRHQGIVQSAVLSFYFRDHVIPYYAGARRDGIRLAVYDFMYWSLLVDAMERGYRVFDFGRSKRGTGSFDFKRHWGFEPIQLAYQYRLGGGMEIPDLSPKNPKFSFAIRVWRHLPLRLTQWIGPSIVRYFP